MLFWNRRHVGTFERAHGTGLLSLFHCLLGLKDISCDECPQLTQEAVASCAALLRRNGLDVKLKFVEPMIGIMKAAWV